jgi:hypothetical protein
MMLGDMPTITTSMTPTELMCTTDVDAAMHTTDVLMNGTDAAAVTKACLVTRSVRVKLSALPPTTAHLLPTLPTLPELLPRVMRLHVELHSLLPSTMYSMFLLFSLLMFPPLPKATMLSLLLLTFLLTVGSWCSVMPMPLLLSLPLTCATALRSPFALWMHLRDLLRLPLPVGSSTSRSMTTITLPDMLTNRVLMLSSPINNSEISFPLPTSTMPRALKPDVLLLDALMLLLLRARLLLPK